MIKNTFQSTLEYRITVPPPLTPPLIINLIFEKFPTHVAPPPPPHPPILFRTPPLLRISKTFTVYKTKSKQYLLFEVKTYKNA